ncbi:hypothetical protein GEV43_32920 [Actinomadura sp. J1-007]|nr:hypothetical protein [Actinomadura sp. J1-007]
MLPAVTPTHAEDAPPAAGALRAGGIGAIEITLRTRAGIPAIERVTADTDILVGAGTVRTVRDIEPVARAGAAFTVAPGLDDDVLRAAANRGSPTLPGIAAATGAQRAMRAGGWRLPWSAVEARDHAAIETPAREASQRLRAEAAT